MSFLDPIDVPKDLPESHLHELLRLEEADGRHAQEHKKRGEMDACAECWRCIRAMRRIAEGGTSQMMEAIEPVARKLADFAQARQLIECTPEDYWELALRPETRKFYRQQAVEIIEALDLNLDLSIVPGEH